MFSPDIQSPASPLSPNIKSPEARTKTFDYSNASISATTHGTTGERLDLDAPPLGRRSSEKSEAFIDSNSSQSFPVSRYGSEKSQKSLHSVNDDVNSLPPPPPDDLPPPPETMFLQSDDDELEEIQPPPPCPPPMPIPYADSRTNAPPPPPPSLDSKPGRSKGSVPPAPPPPPPFNG